jgi:hypothetical protein
VSGITFDAGGLIALDRQDRRVLTLLARATERACAARFRRQPWRRRSETLPGKLALPD